MNKIFTTEYGSEYFLCGDGMWFRLTFSGKKIDGYVYLGSIDVTKNPAFLPGNSYDYHELVRQLTFGIVPGFSPDFRLGCAPIGVHGCKPGEIVYRDGKLLPKRVLVVSIHVGDEIVEVH